MYIPLKGDEVKFTFTQPLVMWNRCIVREGRFELKFTGRSLQFLLFMRTVLGFYTVINPDPFLYEKIGSSSIHQLWNLTDHGLDIMFHSPEPEIRLHPSPHSIGKFNKNFWEGKGLS